MANALLSCEAYDNNFQKRFQGPKYKNSLQAIPDLQSKLKRRSEELCLEYVRPGRLIFDDSIHHSERMAELVEQIRNEQLNDVYPTFENLKPAGIPSKYRGLLLSIAPGVLAMVVTLTLALFSFSKSVTAKGFFRPEVYYSIVACTILLMIVAIPVFKTAKILKK